MIVPEYWSEAKERIVVAGKARTYKRFGWSDESEEDAYRKATVRLAEALVHARQGEKVRLVDHKVAYNGAEGLPIREEVISRRGDSVITRNGYGAACLNTPDVLFADVDVKERSSMGYGWSIFVLLLAAAFLARFALAPNGELYFWLIIIAAVLSSAFLGNLVSRFINLFRMDPFDTALRKIETFATQHPRWRLRIYRTPNGYRVLAMHGTFNANGQTAQSFMKTIGGDPVYALMCRNQNCFRARLSPKPWRIGIQKHLRPRPGVWPIAEERMSDRRRWVRLYESKASGYAACRFVKTIGNSRSARKCEEVRRLHDDLSRATSDLPIA